MLVGVKAHTIEIYDERGVMVVVHDHRFGEKRTDTLDYRTTLATLTKNVGAWKNSGVREMIPASLRENMDALCRDDLRQIVWTLSQLTKTYLFETAVKAHDEGFRNKPHRLLRRGCVGGQNDELWH